ncbi:MAG: hypothetical protein SPJ29_00635 [Phocaeicola sp.]|nr:hypothetical protein [Phocaeicola sp.]
MNNFTLQLFKKITGIDVDELQADYNRVQTENIAISTQLKYTLQDLSAMEKRVNTLESYLLRIPDNIIADNTTENKLAEENSIGTVATEENTIEETASPILTDEEEINNKALIKELRRRVTLLHQQISQMEKEHKERIEALTAQYEQRLQAAQSSPVYTSVETATDTTIQEPEVIEITLPAQQEESNHTPSPTNTAEETNAQEEVQTTIEETIPTAQQEKSNHTPSPTNTAEEINTQEEVETIIEETIPTAQQEDSYCTPSSTNTTEETNAQEEIQVTTEKKVAKKVEEPLLISFTEETAPTPTIAPATPPTPLQEILPAHYTDVEEMQAVFQTLCENYPYIRISTEKKGQYLFSSAEVAVVKELFEWRFVGKDLVSQHNISFQHNEILHIQGLSKDSVGEKLLCNFDPTTGNIDEISQTLLLAICAYNPLRVTYRSKNGNIVQTCFYHTCFKPEKEKFSLPYTNMFDELYQDDPNLSQIATYSTHCDEARIYQVSQLQSIEVLDVFYTTEKGLDIRQKAIEKATKKQQQDMADLLSVATPRWYKA